MIEDQEKLADEINSTIMSPYCPALLLRDCPSEKAVELKVKILKYIVDNNASKEKVMSWLKAEYGDAINSTPKSQGFGLIGWVAPFIFLIGGGVWLFVWVRKSG